MKAAAPQISAALRLFPSALAVNFLVSDLQFRMAVSDEKFEDWPLEHNKFNLSDVDRLLKFSPSLWEPKSSLKLFARTDLARNQSNLIWIHAMPAVQYLLSKDEQQFIVSFLVDPPASVGESGETLIVYVFVGLFSRSFSTLDRSILIAL
jgi:hypothetical protein